MSKSLMINWSSPPWSPHLWSIDHHHLAAHHHNHHHDHGHLFPDVEVREDGAPLACLHKQVEESQFLLFPHHLLAVIISLLTLQGVNFPHRHPRNNMFANFQTFDRRSSERAIGHMLCLHNATVATDHFKVADILLSKVNFPHHDC